MSLPAVRQGRLSLILATAVAGFLLADGLTCSLDAAAVGADAVVLVNSQSTRHLDFKHFIQPYLDNFGFPYTVQDIATNPPDASLRNYAVIIIGHSQLDTSLAYLSEAAQTEISLAVSNGLGLVNFDNNLFVGEVPRYRFVNEVFGFGYAPSSTGTGVSLPPTEPLSQMHYITARHPTNDVVLLRASLTLPGLMVPATAKVLAWVEGQPLVTVVNCGKGRAVQWGSYDWMVSPILGPVAGLDDVVWRAVVWAARKPFVMRGLPNFVTMRIDDVSGPFGWLQSANAVGFKPFLGLFISNVVESSVAELRPLISSGQATAGIHSFDYGNNFFYFDHVKGQALPDQVQSNNFYVGTQWLTNKGIALSRICATHYSEIGVNAFAGLKAWGVEFVPIEVVPGTVEYSTNPAPWLVGGPYRLYEEPQPGQVEWPTYYADWLAVPGHPEFDGQFFNVYSEVRDASGCGDWCPNEDIVSGTNVSKSISRGVQIAKRALDSMVMSTIFTHEFNIAPISATNWRAILQGITNNLASYSPVYVTLDHASQYVRATRTSRLVSSAFDSDSGQVTATFSGKTDLDTGVYVFTEMDNAISSTFGNVPAFSTPPSHPVVVSGAFGIVSAPAGRTNDAGQTTVFTVTAVGAWPLSYCWYRDGTNALSDGGSVSGARTATLTISNLAGGDTGSYFVVITNATGSVTSAPALLAVADPVITRQPLSRDSVVGATAVFDVSAAGTALEFQWRMDGVPINGASRATLNLTNVGDGDVGSYSVLVSNLYGSVVSSDAELVVYHVPTTKNDQYNTAAGTTLTVPAPGVLGNDTVAGLSNLTARLVGLPAHGFLSLDADGGFVYSPVVSYVGEDAFSYQAVNGPAGSSVTTVTITALADGIFLADDFNRPADPGPLSPWVAQSGNWVVTGDVLTGGTSTPSAYDYAYVTNSWTDYSVEGQIRFSSENAWGGGVGGRLNPLTGAHYAAWIYPEGPGGGSNALRLIKFQTWTSFGYHGTNGVPMQEVNLAAPGTNWHTVKLAFQGNQIGVFYDGKQVMSVTDVEAQAYASGGVCVGMWTSEAVYAMSVDDVVVRPLIVNDSYVVKADQTLAVADPGVLGNDTGVYPTNLVAALVSGPTNGSLTLSANGGFSYAPAAFYSGTDSFSYQASQGEASLGMATVRITVAPHDVPVIKMAPSSRTNNAGTTAVFNASALGTLPLSFQWFWNGTNALDDGDKVSGARSPTLTISNVLGGDGGSYTVVVSNVLGSVTNVPPALLAVIDPIITNQPTDQTKAAGSTAEFSVGVYGTSPGYQWFRDEIPVDGATNATLTLAGVLAGDMGGYHVVVSNAYGSVTSSPPALLTVIDPFIVDAPVSRTNDAGTTVVFSVAALGTLPLSYQWFWNGTNALADRGKVSGARSATLTIGNVLGGDAGRFTVVVSNALGSWMGSLPALLTVVDPVIAAQPLDRTNTAGSTAEFSVGVYGMGPSYQWFKDEMPINGATNSTLALAGVSAADTGGYRVVVSNAYGSVSSRMAHLTVIDPVIVGAPVSRTNDAGTTAVFSVAALGTLPLSYQWFWNGTNALDEGGKVSGARSASLTISNVLGGDAGSYTVVVSNALDSVAGSPPALLTVMDPIITNQPVDRTNTAGSTAEFSVGAHGTGPSYQWFKDEMPINGATTATLTLAAVSAADTGGYRVVVSNTYGSLTSRTAHLTVIDPVIVDAPVSRTNDAGTTAIFSVAALGTLPLSYQWFWNGTNALADRGKVSGARSASLTISNVLGGDAGSFTVEVSNALGSVAGSPPALLTVMDPVITAPPVDQTKTAGSTAEFSVGAYGTSPRYQWFKDEMPINGATNAVLTLAGVLAGDIGSYRVVVSNAYGSATSSPPVLLTVIDPIIVGAPAGQTNDAGTTAVFSVAALGTLPLSYQWFWNGTNALADRGKVSGARSASLTISNVLGGDAGSFTVVVSNALGGAMAGPPGLLTVMDPVITNQPTDHTNVAGSTAEFRVGAYGTRPGYQWFKDEMPINGATNATLTLLSVSAADVGSYRVAVSNAYGNVASRTVRLALVPEPTIESVIFADGIAVITWNSVAGQAYRLQYRDGLDSTDWHDLLPDIIAEGPMTTATNALGAATQRFYQVILAPPPPPPPVLTSIRVDHDRAVITWNSVAGQTYRLQYKNTLGGTNWYNVLPDIVAIGPTTTVTNELGGAAQRFYRVIVAPGELPPFVIASLRITNGTAVITWNSVAGQTYQVQYKDRLTDDGWMDALPAVLATDSTTTLTYAIGSASQRIYRVTLVPAGVKPSIRSISMTNGMVTVVWTSVLNQAYRLQYKNRLTDIDWVSVAPDVTATGPTTSMTHPTGNSPRRFYRVTVVP